MKIIKLTTYTLFSVIYIMTLLFESLNVTSFSGILLHTLYIVTLPLGQGFDYIATISLSSIIDWSALPDYVDILMSSTMYYLGGTVQWSLIFWLIQRFRFSK